VRYNLRVMSTPGSRTANFVPASVLDKRRPSKVALIRGLVRQAPFVANNFRLYFRNGWRRNILGTNVVAPYAVTFYATRGEFVKGWIVEKDFRAREENVWRHSAVPGNLLFIRERAVALLREWFLGTGRRFHPV